MIADTTSPETATRLAQLYGVDHANLMLAIPGECMFEKAAYIGYWRSHGYEVRERRQNGHNEVQIKRPDSPERMAQLKAEYQAEVEAERYARSLRGRLARLFR